MNDYERFLITKHATVAPAGFDVARRRINRKLFKFQKTLVRCWAEQQQAVGE